MTGTTELVIFGIKSGIKLAQQGRQAYVEATMDRSIMLPLPEFSVATSVGNADGFFYGEGRPFIGRIPRLRELYEISTGSARTLSDDEKTEYLDLFADCSREQSVRVKGLTGEELFQSRDTLLSVLSVRQWAAGKRPSPSTAQRVIGTLIEIGVDYLSTAKGVIDERSSAGKALKGFLSAVDDISFSEEGLDEIAGSLFIALLETVEKNPALLDADERTEKLVLSVTHGLVGDMQKRMEALAGSDLEKRASVREWGQLIFRSVLSSAAETVLSDQPLFLGITDEGRQAVVRTISLSLLDLVTADDMVDFKALFSRRGLEKVTKAALRAVAENPDVFGSDNQGFQLIVKQVAQDLSELPFLFAQGIVPEAVRIIIEKTALNSELLWPEEFRNEPARHLLVTAVKETLLVMSRKDAAGKTWAALKGSDLLDILGAVTDEVVQNSDWLLKAADSKHPLLAEVVAAALDALRKIPNHRLDSAALRAILRGVIRAVALRRELLDPIPLGGGEKSAISGVLGIVIDAVFSPEADSRAKWVLARAEVFSIITNAVLERVSETGASADVLDKVRAVLEKIADTVASGKSWSIGAVVEEIRAIS